MPVSLLFDLDDVDLTATRIGPDEIAGYNPQTGDMRQLDRIAWVNDEKTRAVGIKNVGDDEFWVSGHIPGRPLLPGVLMIEAAAQVSSILYRLKSTEARFLGFTRCDDASFRGQVAPGSELVMLCQELRYSPRRFISRTQGLVDGSIVFEVKITGMVM